MKIFISAAEASSDTHAAELLKNLQQIAKERGLTVSASGIGGPKLRAAGLSALIPSEELLAMGFVEVLSRLPKIYKNLDQIEEWAKRERPDVAILCDYPDFHFKLAARLKKHGIRTICFIPPKIWVWRTGRIKRLAELYDRVLSILPFEAKTYQGSKVAFEYVGNPLMDELPLMMSRDEARQSLEVNGTVVCLMVGSRPAELKQHLEPMIRAAVKVSAAVKSPVTYLVPLPETADLSRFQQALAGTVARVNGANELTVRVSQGNAWSAMKAADVAIIKSGTSSLEAAILDCPHCVVYRAHPVSEWIFKNVIRYSGAISLTNLITPHRVVKELILQDFTPQKMADEVLKLLQSPDTAKKMRESFSEIRKILGGTSPSRRAAEVVLKVVSP